MKVLRKQYVLMNKSNALVGLGIKLALFDREHDEILTNLEGYKVSLSPTTPDLWAVKVDRKEVWIALPNEFVVKNCKIICEL